MDHVSYLTRSKTYLSEDQDVLVSCQTPRRTCQDPLDWIWSNPHTHTCQTTRKDEILLDFGLKCIPHDVIQGSSHIHGYGRSTTYYELPTSTKGTYISTSQIDFSTHSRYMDKPSWCPTNWERFQRIFRYDGFVTTPVPFNVNLPLNSRFLVI